MNIWLPQLSPRLPRARGLCRFGRLCPSPAEMAGGAGERLLVQVTEAEEVPTPGDRDVSWYVPAGCGAHLALLRALLATRRPVYLAVNGLGPRSLAEIRAVLEGAEVVLAFDAREVSDVHFLQQLVWLRTQPEPFAVLAETPGHLNVAAMMGPSDLLYPFANAVDFRMLLKILSLSEPDAVRPISPEEIDRLAGQEVSLTVTRALHAGDRLRPDDLTADRTATKGLAPPLISEIEGRVLRYDIEPGEPLTFGHLLES